MEELRCPKCGSDRIAVTDIVDEWGDENDYDKIIQEGVGFCCECGCKVGYERVLQIVGYRDIKPFVD